LGCRGLRINWLIVGIANPSSRSKMARPQGRTARNFQPIVGARRETKRAAKTPLEGLGR